MLADISFSVPISVTFANGLERRFESLHDTLDFLEKEWPLRHGERYQRACQKCRAAIFRQTPVAVAREALIAACFEAGLPVHATPLSRQPPDPSPWLQIRA